MPELCPNRARYEQLLNNQLSNEAAEALTQHLENCGECQQLIEELAGNLDWYPSREESETALQEEDLPAPVSKVISTILRQLEKQPESPETAPERESDRAYSFLDPVTESEILGRLGEYDVLEEIGRGGMGIVFKARDRSLDRIVAIKVLTPELAHKENARARFLREARAAAAIAHDHVVTIHAVVEDVTVPYLAMQFVAGRTLTERLAQSGRLLLVEVLRIGWHPPAPFDSL